MRLQNVFECTRVWQLTRLSNGIDRLSKSKLKNRPSRFNRQQLADIISSLQAPTAHRHKAPAEIDAAEKQYLDDAEGLGSGYEEKSITLKDCTGQTYEASTYFASQQHKDAALRPYSWYIHFVIEGAKQHGLPADYVSFLERVESSEDQNRGRDARSRRIICN